MTVCILGNSLTALTLAKALVNYKIDVRLNDDKHTLSAYEKIKYKNNSFLGNKTDTSR